MLYHMQEVDQPSVSLLQGYSDGPESRNIGRHGPFLLMSAHVSHKAMSVQTMKRSMIMPEEASGPHLSVRTV